MHAAAVLRTRAILMLVLATFLWSLSFPLIKALGQTHANLVPSAPGALLTVYTIAPRFWLAIGFLIVVTGGKILRLSAIEWRQGIKLGLFVSGGMLLQNEGLRHTEASTSAFLTQLYAILIPLWHAVWTRRNPGGWVWLAVALVLAGVAILGRFDWTAFRLGWGESVTLLSSLFYMGQILTLEEPASAKADPLRLSFVLFLVVALVFGVLACWLTPSWPDLLVPWRNVPWLGMTVALTAFCTLAAFTLMNAWQPKITSTEAGLIYCIEPVFGSLMALVLPAYLSLWAGIAYANETATWTLIVGGVLITIANVVIQVKPPAASKTEA